MHAINNYPSSKKTFKFSIVLYTVFGIVGIVIICWLLYAHQYRYSSERINIKLQAKYQVPSDEWVAIMSNGRITNNIASALVTSRRKSSITQSNVSMYSLPVVTNCAPIDKTCISL